MKKIILLCSAVLLSTVFNYTKAQSDAEMKAWTEYMTPGDMHKMLASSDGEWEGEILMWMAPGTDPMKNTGTCVNEMILGGRYQLGKFKGSFNGMPFEGMSLVGYDNVKKVFESTWVDNMGTGIMHLQGKWDEKSKSMELKGVMVDCMVGKEVPVRETFTIVDENTQVMEMFAYGPDKKEFKNMQITYRRKK